MRHIDGVYTQRFNRRHKRDGPLFRGRYRAILIERDPYLLAVSRYIHHDPVEAGMVKRPEEYWWSSLRYYLGERGRPQWLDTEEVLEYFGYRNMAFLAFMHGEMDEEVVEFYRRERVGPILGRADFVERIRRQQGARGSGREIPERRYLAVDIEACVEAVARVYGVKKEEIVRACRGIRNRARQVAMYGSREVGGYSHDEIARRMGVGSYSTVSSACAGLGKELAREKGLQKEIEKIRHALLGQ